MMDCSIESRHSEVIVSERVSMFSVMADCRDADVLSAVGVLICGLARPMR